jgi:HK97 gp10 family phage protein
MMATVRWKLEGAEELKEILRELNDDFGAKDAKTIMKRGVREAMKPALYQAKLLAPADTGALRASLRIETRKPTKKDLRSKYVRPTDSIIGTVTTAPGPVLARTKFHNLHNTKSNIKQVGIPSDARAVAMEFGTANVAAKPFLRPALESQSQAMVESLADHLRTALEKYKARKTKGK